MTLLCLIENRNQVEIRLVFCEMVEPPRSNWPICIEISLTLLPLHRYISHIVSYISHIVVK